MPGVERLSVDLLLPQVERCRELGIPAVALFPVTPPHRKSEDGVEAWNEDNLCCRAIRAIKRQVPGIGVVGDVALDPYTTHGQDGLVRDGVILNDETLEALTKQALALAASGCDVVAPSDMMDGRIGAIRAALDGAGHPEHRDPLLRRQVRLGVLRAVPRRLRLEGQSRPGGQEDLPDGRGERRPRRCARRRSTWPRRPTC